jgi:hypothetical protein
MTVFAWEKFSEVGGGVSGHILGVKMVDKTRWRGKCYTTLKLAVCSAYG